MKQSSSLANSSSARQGIPRILWNLRFRYGFQDSARHSYSEAYQVHPTHVRCTLILKIHKKVLCISIYSRMHSTSSESSEEKWKYRVYGIGWHKCVPQFYSSLIAHRSGNCWNYLSQSVQSDLGVLEQYWIL